MFRWLRTPSKCSDWRKRCTLALPSRTGSLTGRANGPGVMARGLSSLQSARFPRILLGCLSPEPVWFLGVYVGPFKIILRACYVPGATITAARPLCGCVGRLHVSGVTRAHSRGASAVCGGVCGLQVVPAVSLSCLLRRLGGGGLAGGRKQGRGPITRRPIGKAASGERVSSPRRRRPRFQGRIPVLSFLLR